MRFNASEAQKVLIETYWNVNMRSQKKDRDVFRVLIETYWNVNH